MEVEYYTIAEFQSCISDGISFRGGQKAEVSCAQSPSLTPSLYFLCGAGLTWVHASFGQSRDGVITWAGERASEQGSSWGFCDPSGMRSTWK